MLKLSIWIFCENVEEHCGADVVMVMMMVNDEENTSCSVDLVGSRLSTKPWVVDDTSIGGAAADDDDDDDDDVVMRAV